MVAVRRVAGRMGHRGHDGFITEGERTFVCVCVCVFDFNSREMR